MNLVAGGEDPAWSAGIAARTGGENDSGIDIGGTPGTPGTPATPATPAQEPAGTPIFNTNGGVEKMDTDCGAASNSGGENLGNPGCNTATVNTGNGGVTTETYIVGRK